MSAASAPYQLGWDIPEIHQGTVIVSRQATRERLMWWPQWVRLPRVSSWSASLPQQQAKEVRDWTGMSARALAAVLGTSHPTVSALLSGQATEFSRRPEIRQRLRQVHALCERLAPLVDYDPPRLMEILTVEVAAEERIVDLAAKERTPEAYLAALRYITPTEEGFPGSVFPAVPGEATAALHD